MDFKWKNQYYLELYNLFKKIFFLLENLKFSWEDKEVKELSDDTFIYLFVLLIYLKIRDAHGSTSILSKMVDYIQTMKKTDMYVVK